jgi:hypothetical protein
MSPLVILLNGSVFHNAYKENGIFLYSVNNRGGEMIRDGGQSWEIAKNV